MDDAHHSPPHRTSPRTGLTFKTPSIDDDEGTPPSLTFRTTTTSSDDELKTSPPPQLPVLPTKLKGSSRSSVVRLELGQEGEVTVNDDDDDGGRRKTFTVEEVLLVIGTSWRKLLLTFAAATLYGSFMANNILPTLTTASIWTMWPDLEYNKPYYNMVFAGQALARLIGSLVLIPCQDLIGRRNQLFLCSAVFIVFTGATCVCRDFWSYLCMRFFASFVAAALPSTTQVYVIEIVSANRRALPSTLLQVWQVTQTMILTAVNLGLVKIEGAESSSSSWKYLYAFSLLFPIIGVVILLIFRVETPRYVAMRGEHSRTWNELSKLTKGGTAETLARQLNVSDVYACRLDGVSPSPPENETFWQILKDNFIRMYTIATDRSRVRGTISLSLLWATTAVGFWGFTTYMTTFFKYIGLSSNSTTFYCLAIQLPGFAIQWWFMRKPGILGGRLFIMRFCSVWCATGLLALVWCLRRSPESTKVLMLFSLWTYMFSNPLWGVIYTYSSEYYPTSHRGAAMALFGTINSLCTFITTFIGSISVTHTTAWRYPLIWACFYLGSFFIALVLKDETQTTILQDTLLQQQQQQQQQRDDDQPLVAELESKAMV